MVLCSSETFVVSACSLLVKTFLFLMHAHISFIDWTTWDKPLQAPHSSPMQRRLPWYVNPKAEMREVSLAAKRRSLILPLPWFVIPDLFRTSSQDAAIMQRLVCGFSLAGLTRNGGMRMLRLPAPAATTQSTAMQQKCRKQQQATCLFRDSSSVQKKPDFPRHFSSTHCDGSKSTNSYQLRWKAEILEIWRTLHNSNAFWQRWPIYFWLQNLCTRRKEDL